jgi:hypothetical protein
MRDFSDLGMTPQQGEEFQRMCEAHDEAVALAAWQLNRKETSGSMNVADFWEELSEEVQRHYSEKVQTRRNT